MGKRHLMKKLKKLSGFLLLAAAVFVTAACSVPVGAIDGGPGMIGGDDALWAVPNRLFYDLDAHNGEFDRSTDLQVFYSDRGIIRVVPLEEAQIYIIENPQIPDNKIPINGSGKYLFLRSGRKNIEIHYKGLTTWYTVEVRGITFGSSDDDFTNIIWF